MIASAIGYVQTAAGAVTSFRRRWDLEKWARENTEAAAALAAEKERLQLLDKTDLDFRASPNHGIAASVPPVRAWWRTTERIQLSIEVSFQNRWVYPAKVVKLEVKGAPPARGKSILFNTMQPITVSPLGCPGGSQNFEYEWFPLSDERRELGIDPAKLVTFQFAVDVWAEVESNGLTFPITHTAQPNVTLDPYRSPDQRVI